MRAATRRYVGLKQQGRPLSDTDADWEKWAQTDAYYAVASHPEYRREQLDDNRSAFFQSGDAYIVDRLARFERYFGTLRYDRALDFGCGVGRLTVPLARYFKEVTGTDVSATMLAEAERNIAAEGLNNIALVPSDGTLSRVTGPFDLVLTYIVLQHIPVARGLHIIARLLDFVGPGGGISLHFSTWRRDSAVKAAAYWFRRHVPGIQAIINVARGRDMSEPLMQMNEYPLALVVAMTQERGFSDVLIDTETHGNVLTATISARRSVG